MSLEISIWISKKQASRDKIRSEVEELDDRIKRLQKKAAEKREAFNQRSIELARLHELSEEYDESWKEIYRLEESEQRLTDESVDQRIDELYRFVGAGSEAQARKIYYNR